MWSIKGKRYLILVLLFSGIGGTLKLYGAALYSSKALYTDGLSCIANFVAILVMITSMSYSSRPPDPNHPYGHGRLAYAGNIFTIAIYALITGIAIAGLGAPEPYTVGEKAVLYAFLGTLAYGVSIFFSRKIIIVGSVLSGFTMSEILEGSLVMAAAYAGSKISYLIDYSGGVIIVGYLIYEIIKSSFSTTMELSDLVEPSITLDITHELESRGLRVKSLRVRQVIPGKFHGDAIVEASGDMNPEVAHLLIDEVTNNMARKGIDLTIHLDIEEGKK